MNCGSARKGGAESLCPTCYIAEHGVSGMSDVPQQITEASKTAFNNSGAVGISCTICAELWTTAGAVGAIDIGALETSVAAHCAHARTATSRPPRFQLPELGLQVPMSGF